MSKADIASVEESIKNVQVQIHEVVKAGTSKGDNRKKYLRLKQRATRLRKWLNELKQKQ